MSTPEQQNITVLAENERFPMKDTAAFWETHKDVGAFLCKERSTREGNDTVVAFIKGSDDFDALEKAFSSKFPEEINKERHCFRHGPAAFVQAAAGLEAMEAEERHQKNEEARKNARGGHNR